ncbi:hypothetical protein BU23DRAFT_656875 [Bimuria novae-zelandiae CBS 107.79]|uniref:rhamnogalacturonan endolyase n=1 Tax=Bimuria novae-zelandiae CBS 107.79 TaxID=1447943 RepID=A0A6A5UWH1_9PLEO|nr:hypothetical protein BU23DRAFT_656875 [Bimuria novae-zelandiae CBS 107.79]
MNFSTHAAAILALCERAYAAFGLTSTNAKFIIDTDGGLVFKVNKSNGDITSLKHNGVEYQGTGKASAINFGLGTSTVTGETVNGYVEIKVKASGLPVTQYYVAKPKEPTIYMATYITKEIDPGELRWLARLRTSELPTGVHGNVGDTRGCTAFEGKDTFKCPDDRFIDEKIHCVSGSKVQVCMIMPGTAHESSASGPFMRDINSQTGSSDQELYWYMNSGYVRTEKWRFGLQGPYAMTFASAGTKPSEDLDTSFFSSPNIQGYVAASGRGTVTGTATGVPNGFETVVHWFNTNAQYWTKASDGKFTSPLMKPRSYSMRLYKGEFLVANETVTVAAGQTATKDIASKELDAPVIWRIGEFDGRPSELKNGDRIERMHPSDTRISSWSGAYTVGQSKASDFSMALWSKQGTAATVIFTLTQEQVKGHVLRIGTTLSFKRGRPSVMVNNWTGADPGAPALIDTPGVTRGAVPSSAFKVGSNTLTVGVYGSGDSTWLSANYIVDALELQD